VIVVIGSPSALARDGVVRAVGLSSLIAIAAAAHGRTVQLVGRLGDDGVADAVLQDLARQGVGHVAVLRDPAHPTPADTAADGSVADHPPTATGLELEPEDVELALRYLTDFAVVAVVGESGSVLAVVERAASWGTSALVVVGGVVSDAQDAAGHLGPVAGETSDAFARRVGDRLAALDAEAGPVRSVR